MNAKLLAFFLFVYLIGFFLGTLLDHNSNMCSVDTDGVTHCYDSTLNYLLDVKNLTRSSANTGTVSIAMFNVDYIGTFVQSVFLWFPNLWEGDFVLVWIFIFAPLCAMGLLALISFSLQIIQGFLPW